MNLKVDVGYQPNGNLDVVPEIDKDATQNGSPDRKREINILDQEDKDSIDDDIMKDLMAYRKEKEI